MKLIEFFKATGAQELTEGMSFYPSHQTGPKRWGSVFPSNWTETPYDWEKVDDYKAQMDPDYEMPLVPEYRSDLDMNLTGSNMEYLMRDVLGFQTDDPNVYHLPIDEFLKRATGWLQQRISQQTPQKDWEEAPREFKRQVSTDPETGVPSISGGPQGPRMISGGRSKGYDEERIMKMVKIAQTGKEMGATHVTAV